MTYQTAILCGLTIVGGGSGVAQARRPSCRRERPVRADWAPQVRAPRPSPGRAGGQSPGTPKGPSRASRTQVRRVATDLWRRFRHEPTIRRVQRAAVRRANLSPALARSWLKRVRRSAWAPRVQMGSAAHVRKDNAVDREAGEPDLLKIGAVNQITYEIKLSWDLPSLIFDPNELKVIREAQRIAELRDQIVSQVTRLYFERRRHQLAGLLNPARTTATALRRQLRVAELTAMLNALTGGLFRPTR